MSQFSKLALALLVITASLFAQSEEGLTAALKSEGQAQKRVVIALNIVFTDSTDSQNFWAIYDEFETSVGELTDKSVAIIKEYAENYNTMTGEEAVKLTNESMDVSAQRAKLLKKTFKKIAKISPIEAARFVQIENRINLMVRFQTALELPVIMPEEVQKEVAKEIKAFEAAAPVVQDTMATDSTV